jgi:N6-adenosine-specific RNA methylase IME4
MKTIEPKINPVAESFLNVVPQRFYGTILADPPWRFLNRTGKVAPEHKRLNRYETLSLNEIMEIPVKNVTAEKSHLYLWVPNALLPEGLEVLKAWGFSYKSNIIWHKVRKDGGPDGRGVGFYFRNTTELILFGVKGSIRTLNPGRSQVNIIRSQKQEHSRKPDELYDIIENCSVGPYLEIFARGKRNGWDAFGDQAEDYQIDWATYTNNSQLRNPKTQLTEIEMAVNEINSDDYRVHKAPIRNRKKKHD